MTEDREKLLESIEGLKTKIVAFMDEQDSLKQEGEELRSARRESEEKVWAVEEESKKKDEEIAKLTKRKESLESKLESASSELDQAKQNAENLEVTKDEAVAEIKRERDELRAEMDDITGKLERVSELYRETADEKEKLEEKVDVSDLLGIYIMLIETVFYGKPHARILYTLHNTKKAITRRNIASSTGIMPAVVQKAIFDLANAELVTYDEETQEASLQKDIF
ncbi:MAG: hypothetical protein ACW99U_07770 [Candidatus Thorarchaeota archaeon]|jgi:predicted  nucleic acid-binding Zn-ribbon protein